MKKKKLSSLFRTQNVFFFAAFLIFSMYLLYLFYETRQKALGLDERESNLILQEQLLLEQYKKIQTQQTQDFEVKLKQVEALKQATDQEKHYIIDLKEKAYAEYREVENIKKTLKEKALLLEQQQKQLEQEFRERLSAQFRQQKMSLETEKVQTKEIHKAVEDLKDKYEEHTNILAEKAHELKEKLFELSDDRTHLERGPEENDRGPAIDDREALEADLSLRRSAPLKKN